MTPTGSVSTSFVDIMFLLTSTTLSCDPQYLTHSSDTVIISYPATSDTVADSCRLPLTSPRCKLQVQLKSTKRGENEAVVNSRS
jgi:hypothetical protein